MKAKRGKQPTVKTSGKRKGYKVFGLMDYITGELFSKGQEGKLNSEAYIEFLKGVLRETKEHIYLIQDGASYHTSKATKSFFTEQAERITVIQLPSYSPDYNPIEKLWKKIKQQETHLHYFETLIEKVEQALQKFKNARTEVLALCGSNDSMLLVA